MKGPRKREVSQPDTDPNLRPPPEKGEKTLHFFGWSVLKYDGKYTLLYEPQILTGSETKCEAKYTLLYEPQILTESETKCEAKYTLLPLSIILGLSRPSAG